MGCEQALRPAGDERPEVIVADDRGKRFGIGLGEMLGNVHGGQTCRIARSFGSIGQTTHMRYDREFSNRCTNGSGRHSMSTDIVLSASKETVA
jgi:hypothetical protein